MFKHLSPSSTHSFFLLILFSVFLLLMASCDGSDSPSEVTEKAPLPVEPTPLAEADEDAGAEDDPPQSAEPVKLMGSYRGIHDIHGEIGKPVFRWTRPGGEYPDGLVVRWPGGSQKISDTSRFYPNYRCDDLHWNPKSGSTTEWGGKLVVMLDCDFQGVEECWLEFEPEPGSEY